jgi:hypothetical protein
VLAGLNTKPAITYLARVVAQETPAPSPASHD